MTKPELVKELERLGEKAPKQWSKAEVEWRVAELGGNIKKDAETTEFRKWMILLNRAGKKKADLQEFVRNKLFLPITGNETIPVLMKMGMRQVYQIAPISAEDPVGFGVHASLAYEEVSREHPTYCQWASKTVQEGATDYRTQRLVQWYVCASTATPDTEVPATPSPATSGEATSSQVPAPVTPKGYVYPAPVITPKGRAYPAPVAAAEMPVPPSPRAQAAGPQGKTEEQIRGVAQKMASEDATFHNMMQAMNEMAQGMKGSADQCRAQLEGTRRDARHSSSKELQRLLRVAGHGQHRRRFRAGAADGDDVSEATEEDKEDMYNLSVLTSSEGSKLAPLSSRILPDAWAHITQFGKAKLVEVACSPKSILTTTMQQTTGQSESSFRWSHWNGHDLSQGKGVKIVLV